MSMDEFTGVWSLAEVTVNDEYAADMMEVIAPDGSVVVLVGRRSIKFPYPVDVEAREYWVRREAILVQQNLVPGVKGLRELSISNSAPDEHGPGLVELHISDESGMQISPQGARDLAEKLLAAANYAESGD